MKFSRKTALVITTFATALLAGCQSQSNIINLTTPAPTAVFNTANQGAIVNVSTQDWRTSREIATYTRLGQVQRLTSSPEVGAMFQQMMQQNLNSKGFSLAQGTGNVNVLVNVKKFFANVTEGNVAYKIDAEVGVEVVVQGSKGNYTKNFNATRGYEGAFGADNDGIKKILNQAYSDVVQAIYNDNEIGNAINQYR